MRLGPITSTSKGDVHTHSQTGMLAGTSILTLDGALPIEHLALGDRIITRDSGVAVLKAIRARKAKTRMIRIKAGTLGNSRPDGDMVLPADQKVLLRDWRAKAIYGQKNAVVPISKLIDGEFIAEHATSATVTLFELEFDAPHVIYADGLELSVSDRVKA